MRDRSSTPARKVLARIVAEALEGRTLLAVFAVTNVNDAGPGSLRQAIEDANSNQDRDDVIVFDIPGETPGVRTIRPLSALPEILEPVTIDGTTQPGYAGSPLIELDGSASGLADDGLVISAGDTVIRGLAINRWGRNGIVLTGGEFTAGNNVLVGNYIGVAPDGSTVAGNGLSGILIDSSPDNVIGGPAAADRNVISGNGLFGVQVMFQSAARNVIAGNRIGTDAAGAVALPNRSGGVALIEAVSNTVGGTFGANGQAVPAGNLISGNQGSSVLIEGFGATGHVVSNNLIGTDASGQVGLGNAAFGVFIAGASDNVVADNVVTSSAVGVAIVNEQGEGQIVPVGNQLRRNRIFGNTLIGIDLGGDGPTANDPGDQDFGPNGLQNVPVITSASVDGSILTIAGIISTSPDTDVAIDLFAAAAPLSVDAPQGQVYLGSVNVTTDAAGQATFSANFASEDLSAIEADDLVATATATTGDDGTSEFSAGIEIAGGGVVPQPPAVTALDVAAVAGESATRTVAIFTDASFGVEIDPADYVVTIFWGDDTSSAGTVTTTGVAGQLAVTGTHTYSAAGTYSINVHVAHPSSERLGQGSATATVSPQQPQQTLQLDVRTLRVEAGVPLVRVQVAKLTDLAVHSGSSPEFEVTVDFGDGTGPQPALVRMAGGGNYFVRASHTYAANVRGWRTLTVAVIDLAGERQVIGTGRVHVARRQVAPPRPVRPEVTAINIVAVAGAPTGRVPVALFADPAVEGKLNPVDYRATIYWGDDSSSSGRIVARDDGRLTVLAENVYVLAGSYDVEVVVRAVASGDGGSEVVRRGSAVGVARVASAPRIVTQRAIRPVAGRSFSGTVLRFLDANPFLVAEDFSAVIDWGDGTVSTGSVRQLGDGLFAIVGRHVYATSGRRTVTVTLFDPTGDGFESSRRITVARRTGGAAQEAKA